MKNFDKRIVIFEILKKSGGKIDKLRLFKLIFLLCKEIKDLYNFIPYKYGPYSFILENDLKRLSNRNYLNENENNIELKKSIQYKNDDNINLIIDLIWNKYNLFSTNDLIKRLYSKYPFYGQFSVLKIKTDYKIKPAPLAIYSIGYQNISIDKFIMILLNKGIKNLLDIRYKPYSFKYGFSKYWFKKYLNKFEINYINIPQLGIPKELRDKYDRKELLKKYEKELDNKASYIEETLEIINSKSTSLLCFEENPLECHRSVLANKLKTLNNFQLFHYLNKKGKWLNYGQNSFESLNYS